MGESNDIFKRTRQHYDVTSDKSRWQSKLVEKDANLFIIGHEHFNNVGVDDVKDEMKRVMSE